MLSKLKVEVDFDNHSASLNFLSTFDSFSLYRNLLRNALKVVLQARLYGEFSVVASSAVFTVNDSQNSLIIFLLS